MFRRLMFVTIVAMAALPCAQPQASQSDPQKAQMLAGVRSKISQLRAELQMNRAALASGGLPADDKARLNARASQIVAEIDALQAQEREITRR